jgi:DNA-binding winged helix-turn-helix (wHTH) protein/Tol biopolymer transport system component
VFEYDPKAKELWKTGIPIRLQEQPARLLNVLILKPGRIVTREEIERALWPSGTFVDFDAGLKTAMRRVRVALGDDAENPRFIETVPKQGFRFIAPVYHVMPTPDAVKPPKIDEPPVPAAAPADPQIIENKISRRHSSPYYFGALAAGFAAVAGLGIWLIYHNAHSAVPVSPVSRLTLELPSNQEIIQNYGADITFSPDGRYLAYIARSAGKLRLYLRDLAQHESHLLSGMDMAVAPIFDPDGRSIVAYSGNHLRRFYLDGRFTDLAEVSPQLAIFGSAWDGKDLLYDDTPPDRSEGLSTVYRLREGTGKPERAVSRRAGLTRDETDMIEQVLPGKSYLLNSWGGQDEEISVFSGRDGSRKKLIERGRGGLVLPGGYFVYWAEGNLKAAPFDSGGMAMTAPAVTLVKNVGFSGWQGAEMAVSTQGTLAYVERTSEVPDRRLVWIDHGGREVPVPIPPAPLEPVAVSPDGRNLLIMRYDRGEKSWTLIRYSLTDGSSSQLTAPSQLQPWACWTPDGQSVVYTTRTEGTASNLVQRPARGEGADVKLTNFETGGMVPYGFSPDGRWIVGTRGMLAATKSDIFAVAVLKPGEQNFIARPLVQTPDYDTNPALSPDGQWLAYTTEHRIFIQAFPGESGATPFFFADGEGPMWDPSGRKLYSTRDGEMAETDVSFHPHPAAGKSTPLFKVTFMLPGLWTRRIYLSPDGKRFLVTREEKDRTEGKRIQMVVNWFSELEATFHPNGR